MARYFSLISNIELKHRIRKAAAKELNEEEETDFRIGYAYQHLSAQVKKDLKVRFDLENCEDNPDSENADIPGLLGYHTLENGFTFCGVWGGGDWEIPLFFCIYWDGKNLRAYIPTAGNPWNTDTHEAYGNSELDLENARKRFPELIPADVLDISECEIPCISALILADIQERILSVSSRRLQ